MSDILYHAENGVAVIRFNRPQALNAVTFDSLAQLSAAFDRAASEPEVKVVVLTGEGRGFCSGADLAQNMANPPRDAEGKLDLGLPLEQYYNPLVLKMRAMPKPIIAAVNGMAAGAGASFALMADLTIAARSAYFLQAFVNIGLVPDAGGTWLLPRSIGPQRAMGLAMLGEKLPAEKAKEWGLIWDVVDDDQLMTTVNALAHRLATGPGAAIARIKQVMHAAPTNELAEQLLLERELQRECGHTNDFAEGTMAFMQKRKANFKGH
jgi:2-(1,2-epoxy-1,2-dihydrophenyl)acetyl-CoA isomerase